MKKSNALKVKNLRNLSLTSFLLLSSITMSSAVFAQYGGDDQMMQDTTQYIDNSSHNAPYNSAQIDVDGRYDRLDKVRRQLEKQNQQMVRKKIEDVRMKNESKLTKQLKDAFHGNGFAGKQESVAAPITSVASVASVAQVSPALYEEKTRVSLSAGGMAISGDRNEIESNKSVSLLFETDMSARFSMGVALTYVSADLLEDNNSYNRNNYNGFNYNNYPYYNAGYRNIYGEGREMSYSRLGIEAQGKYFFTKTKRFAPYVGLGMSINRSKLSYADNQEYNYNGGQFGDEYYKGNSLAGSVMLGTEINFSKSFGAIVEVKGGKGFGSFGSFGQKTQQQNFYNLDQARLDALGEDFEEASFGAASLGFFVQF